MANEAIDMIRQAEAWAEETSAGAAAKRAAEEKAANERARQIVEEARARAQAEAKESAERLTQSSATGSLPPEAKQ